MRVLLLPGIRILLLLGGFGLFALAIEVARDACDRRLRYAVALDAAYTEALYNGVQLKAAVDMVGKGDSSYATMGTAAASVLLNEPRAPERLRFFTTAYLAEMGGRDRSLDWLRETFQREKTVPEEMRDDLQAHIGRGMGAVDTFRVALESALQDLGLTPPTAVQAEREVVMPRAPKGVIFSTVAVDENRDRLGGSWCFVFKCVLE